MLAYLGAERLGKEGTQSLDYWFVSTLLEHTQGNVSKDSE